MSRVYSYIVCHVYIVILYVLYDDVCMYKTSQIKFLFCIIQVSFVGGSTADGGRISAQCWGSLGKATRHYFKHTPSFQYMQVHHCLILFRIMHNLELNWLRFPNTNCCSIHPRVPEFSLFLIF